MKGTIGYRWNKDYFKYSKNEKYIKIIIMKENKNKKLKFILNLRY